MKKVILLFVCLLFLYPGKEINAQCDITPPGTWSSAFSPIADSNGNVFHVFTNSSNEKSVRKYDGTGYTDITPAGDWYGISSPLADQSGNVYYVFYTYISFVFDYYIYKYDGTNFTDITPSGTWRGISNSIADSAGNLYYSMKNTANEMRLQKYDGSSFTDITPPGPWKYIGSPHVDTQDSLYVALTAFTNNYYIYKYNGTTFSDITPSGTWSSIRLPVEDTSGNVFWAFRKSSNNYYYIYKYDGSSFTDLTPTSAWGFVSSPVADSTGNIYYPLKYIYGTTWQLRKYDGSIFSDITPVGTWNLLNTPISDTAGNIYYHFRNSSNLWSLYKYNGTSMTDISPAGSWYYPGSPLMDQLGYLYFFFGTATPNYQLFKYDGNDMINISPPGNFGGIYEPVKDNGGNFYYPFWDSDDTNLEIVKYSSCGKDNSLPSVAGIYQSTFSCTDANNWRHFCDCEGNLLLSLNLSNAPTADIADDDVKIKVADPGANYHPAGTGFITNPFGAAIMNRRWEVNPTIQPGGGETVDVRAYFLQTDFDLLNDTLDAEDGNPGANDWALTHVNQMEFFKVTNNGLGEFPDIPDIDDNDAIVLHYNSGNPGTTSWTEGTHGTVDHYYEFKVSSFSGGGGGSGGGGLGGSGLLPVEWMDFSGRQEGEAVLLYWMTATERNNDGFWIERSKNPGSTANDWEEIGFVKGQNTSSTTHTYTFQDDAPFEGDNYYRLKQTDYNGHHNYSEVRHIQIVSGELNTIDIYPNPTPGHFLINIRISGSQNGLLKLIDSFGRLVWKHRLSTDSTAGKWEKECYLKKQGLYLLIMEINGQVQVRKVIVMD